MPIAGARRTTQSAATGKLNEAGAIDRDEHTRLGCDHGGVVFVLVDVDEIRELFVEQPSRVVADELDQR